MRYPVSKNKMSISDLCVHMRMYTLYTNMYMHANTSEISKIWVLGEGGRNFGWKLAWRKMRRMNVERFRWMDPWVEVGYGNLLGVCSHSAFCSCTGPWLQICQTWAPIKSLAGALSI